MSSDDKQYKLPSVLFWRAFYHRWATRAAEQVADYRTAHGNEPGATVRHLLGYASFMCLSSSGYSSDLLRNEANLARGAEASAAHANLARGAEASAAQGCGMVR